MIVLSMFEICQGADYAARSESPHRNRDAFKPRTPKKKLLRKVGNKRHPSLTNQKSFLLIGSFQEGKLASWQALLSDRHSKSRLHLANNRSSCRNCMPRLCSSD